MGSADLRLLLKEAWQSLLGKADRASRAYARVEGFACAIFEEVEARILFSADFAPGLIDPAAPSDPTQSGPNQLPSRTPAPIPPLPPLTRLAPPATTTARRMRHRSRARC